MLDGIYPKYFRKAIKGVVGGKLMNKRGEIEEFVLRKGDPSAVDPDSITIEVPDEDAEKFFVKYNKPALQKGILVSVSDYEIRIDPVNSVTDGDLKDIIKMPLKRMEKRVSEFTSPVPIGRLLDLVRAENKPIKTVEMIQNALQILEGSENMPISEITSDNIKVKSI